MQVFSRKTKVKHRQFSRKTKVKKYGFGRKTKVLLSSTTALDIAFATLLKNSLSIHLISRVAHRAYFLDGDERMRLVYFVRRVAKLAAAEIRLDEGWQAANRKGRAAMTRKTYRGNLL